MQEGQNHTVLALFCHSTDLPSLNKLHMLNPQSWGMAGRNALHLGANTATVEFCRALIKHRGASDLLLVAGGRTGCERLNNELSKMRPPLNIKQQTRACELPELGSIPPRQLVLFEPGGITPKYFDLRRLRMGQVFPLTFAHHTISYRFQLLDTFLPLLLSHALPCDSVICSSHASKKAVQNILEYLDEAVRAPSRRYNGRLDVIPFGIDTEEFRPIDSVQCRTIFNLPKNRPLILYFGRISISDKADLSPLIMVFKEVLRRVDPLRPLLVIAGNPRDSDLKAVQQQVRQLGLEGDVRFLSHVSYEERPYLYCIADVFVSPADNLQECFGLSVLEAMACGVPQVVSDWSGYRDTVVDGVTGFLIPTYWAACDAGIIMDSVEVGPMLWDHFELAQSVCVDIASLADRLANLVVNKGLRLSMARESRARACLNYDWRVIVSKCEDLWSELREVASAITPDRLGRSSVSVSAYHRIFEHFATMNVEETWHVLPGARQGIGNFQSWPKASFLNIDPTSLMTLIESFFQTQNGRTCVRDIFDLFPRADQAEVMRTFMFLAKQGYVAVVPPRLPGGLSDTVTLSSQTENDVEIRQDVVADPR